MVRLQPKGRDLTGALRLAAVCVALLCSALSSAQFGSPLDSLQEAATSDGVRPGVAISFGFANTFVADAWSPMRISLTGGDDPVAGRVIVEYDHRRGGPMRVVAPYAAAPGQTTPVDVTLPFGAWIQKLTVRIEDDRGRALRLFNFEDWSDFGVGVAPNVLSSGTVFVGAVGAPSLDVASREWIRVRTEAMQKEIEESQDDVLSAQQQLQSKLLGSQAAVSSGTVLAQIGIEDLSPNPSAYRTLSVLVLGGESLQALSRPTVQAIRTWVESGGRLVVMLDRPGPGYERYLPEGVIDAATTPSVQESNRIGRSLFMAPGGAPSWRVTDVGGVPMADGPLGLGWVVVVGADPAPEVAEQIEIASAWDAVLAPLIEGLSERAGEEGDNVFIWWRGAGARTSTLLDALAEDLDNVTSVGFWPMIFVLLGLATLLGPVDYFVLKKRHALHRSWITALCWIGVFTALGAVAPGLMRSDHTQLRSIRAVDVSQSDGVAHGAGVLGVFAGESGGVELTGVNNASRWKPTQVARSESFGAAMTLVRTPQGGVVPGVLPARRWSFLTFIDESPATSVATARVTRNLSGAFEVRVTGLSGTVRRAAMLASDGWRPLEFSGTDGGALAAVAGDLTDVPPEAWTSVPMREDPVWMPRRGGRYAYEPWMATGLPGFDARGDLMMLRIERGDEVVVCLDIEHATPDVSAVGVEDQSQRTIYRILAPITAGEFEVQPEGAT
jgi:hypothetical protein